MYSIFSVYRISTMLLLKQTSIIRVTTMHFPLFGIDSNEEQVLGRQWKGKKKATWNHNGKMGTLLGKNSNTNKSDSTNIHISENVFFNLDLQSGTFREKNLTVHQTRKMSQGVDIVVCHFVERHIILLSVPIHHSHRQMNKDVISSHPLW